MSKILQYIQFDHQTEAINVCFGIRSDDLNPSIISSELGVKPTWAFSKGESYLGKSLKPETKEIIYVERQYPWGVWALDTRSLANVMEIEDHLFFLLSILEPKQEELEKYLKQEEKYILSFSIYWSPIGSYTGSYEINSQILSRICKLSHYTEFSFLAKGD